MDSNFDLCRKFSKELLDSQASVVTTKEKNKKIKNSRKYPIPYPCPGSKDHNVTSLHAQKDCRFRFA